MKILYLTRIFPDIAGNGEYMSWLFSNIRDHNKVTQLISCLLDNEKVARDVGKREFAKLVENYLPTKILTQIEEVYKTISYS